MYSARRGDENSISKLQEAFEFFVREVYEKKNEYQAEVLGKFYEFGLATQKNYEKAIECYQISVNSGNVDAYNSLGSLYYSGIGVPVDLSMAYDYFLKAANKGNHSALNKLGNMYLRGIYVEKDANQALSYL
jgi:TPR repeat protein